MVAILINDSKVYEGLRARLNDIKDFIQVALFF